MPKQRLIVTDDWRHTHAGSRAAAVSYRNVAVVAETAALAGMKRELEAMLRDRWGSASKQELLADPTLSAYQQYDQRFGQNYHVAMQIRSIAQKGKAVPDRNPLIEAMFMTELRTGVLASVQDFDQIGLPITVDSADGTERYKRYDGVEEQCKTGDQVMIEAGGNVLTSIAQGPTSFGLVGPETTAVTYCFYFVPGVSDEVIDESLTYLDQCIHAACPAAEQVGKVIISA